MNFVNRFNCSNIHNVYTSAPSSTSKFQMPSIKGEDVQERSSKRSVKKSRSKICRFNYANPYLNFLWEYRSLPENKSVPLKQLFKIAGSRWKELTLDEKRPYLEAAKSAALKVKEECDQHSNENNSERSRSKAKVKSLKKNNKRNGKGQLAGNNRKPKPKRLRVSPACSNCGHRHGSMVCSEKSVKWSKHEMADKSESKSGSSISRSTDDSRSSTKSGRSRSQSKSTIFETDVSSISTF